MAAVALNQTDHHHEQLQRREEEAEAEAVIVVEDAEHGASSDSEKSNDNDQLRRSFFMDSLPQRERVSIADILQAGGEEEKSERGDDSEGSSHGTAIKRSLSSGRFGFARQGKGRSPSVLPL